MKQYWWQRFAWRRILWWSHAIGVASFYIILWVRTKPGKARPASENNLSLPQLPLVSIIVPARNEERNIRRCVISLLEQDYPSFEVIVVDDGSTDGTVRCLAEIAHTHPQRTKLRVLTVDHLPAGWAGKPHTLHTGTQEAQGDFFLFTDADTWHSPLALRTAVTRAIEGKKDLLSLSTEQELPSFWEKVMMPMAYLGISMQYPFKQINDPRSRVALANGQYILIRQAVYRQLGGYARPELRGTLLDDRDLARLVKQQGFSLELADGRKLVRVRMYRNLRETWRGWRKNAFLGSRGGLPFALLQLPGLPMVTVAPFLLPLWLWLSCLVSRGKSVSPAEASVLSALELGPPLAYRRWMDKEMHLPWYSALTHPLAGLLFTGILAQSTWRVVTRRGVEWSGREYFKGRSKLAASSDDRFHRGR